MQQLQAAWESAALSSVVRSVLSSAWIAVMTMKHGHAGVWIPMKDTTHSHQPRWSKHRCRLTERSAMRQVSLLQQNAPLKKALQAACGKHRWKEPRAVQVALGAMHSLVLIYTPPRLMTAAAGMSFFAAISALLPHCMQ